MDPEDLREVISAYQKCVAETVRRFDGFVATYMGDGVLVYFGYPQAHEDAAELGRGFRAEGLFDVGNIRRRMKRSAGDHNHEGPDAENPEPGDTPEVIRDRAYTWQAGEALRHPTRTSWPLLIPR